MGRYSKVYRRIWNDEKFRKLSPIPPCGQGLWLYLLTCTENQNVPGVFEAREVALADKLRWPLEAFREAFGEALALGMLKANWDVGLLWLPKSIHHNRPESINVVKSWGNTWDDLPECQLKNEAFQYLLAFLEGLGKAYAEAFRKACGKPNGKACAIQEQEQEHIQEQSKSARARAHEAHSQNSFQSESNLDDELVGVDWLQCGEIFGRIRKRYGHGSYKPLGYSKDSDQLSRVASWANGDAAEWTAAQLVELSAAGFIVSANDKTKAAKYHPGFWWGDPGAHLAAGLEELKRWEIAVIQEKIDAIRKTGKRDEETISKIRQLAEESKRLDQTIG